MTRGNGAERAGLQLLALATFCLVMGSNVADVLAEVEPLPPAMIYDNFADDTESLILLNRLKQVIERKQDVMEQERELAEEQIAIQAMLEAKARQQPSFRQYPPEVSDEDTEALPVPSAIVHPHVNPHSNKRTSYLSLCHFKICNMGRKRQM